MPGRGWWGSMRCTMALATMHECDHTTPFPLASQWGYQKKLRWNQTLPFFIAHRHLMTPGLINMKQVLNCFNMKKHISKSYKKLGHQWAAVTDSWIRIKKLIWSQRWKNSFPQPFVFSKAFFSYKFLSNVTSKPSHYVYNIREVQLQERIHIHVLISSINFLFQSEQCYPKYPGCCVLPNFGTTYFMHCSITPISRFNDSAWYCQIWNGSWKNK